MSNTDVVSITDGIIQYLENIGKLGDLPEIVSSLQAHIKTQANLVRVESAQALSEDEKEAVTDWVNKQVGETAIQFTINADVLGGLRLHVGDQCLDLSVANKLTKLYAK